MRRVLTIALATAATIGISTPASASLVYDSTLNVLAQGFGAAPRALTVQGTANATLEGGCVGVSAGGTINVGGTGSCMGHDAGIDPNGVIDSLHDEPPPLTDNQKYGIPTVASLGWASAADIGVLFNVTDPAGNGVNLLDVTLKFYNSAGTLLGSIDGNQIFQGTETGNGSAGFIFTVQGQNEIDYVNAILGAGGTIYTALEATVNGVSGGPESFSIINIHSPPPVPEPATWAMMLLGFGGIGMAMRRRRRNATLMQVA